MTSSYLTETVAATLACTHWTIRNFDNMTLQRCFREGAHSLSEFICVADSVEPQPFNIVSVDFNILYLLLKDWDNGTLTGDVDSDTVCHYFGIDPTKEVWVAKLTTKTKHFAGMGTLETEQILGLRHSILNGYFKSHPIACHALILYAKR